MEPLVIIRENWLTQKPKDYALIVTLAVCWILFAASFGFFNNFLNSEHWMAATQTAVFKQHQWWRAWTALFAHGDMGHLVSNCLLFIPLTYLLSGYYGILFFPLMGIFLGGFINMLVIETLPPDVSLIGISGVVYWMGASWLTLYILIDKRQKLRRRFAISLFLSMMLFVPDTYKPEVSYLSHFLGYLLGIVSATGFYFWKRKDFQRAEVKEYIYDDDDVDWLINQMNMHMDSSNWH